MNEMKAAALFEQVAESPEDRWFVSVAGSLIGAACADALGWITEFVRGREHLLKVYRTERVTEFRPWQKTSGGRFNAYTDYVNRGEYSDDTQLSLAIARSLRGDGSVDLEHFAKSELPLWLAYARGAGSTITAASRGLTRRSAHWNSNFFAYRHRDRQNDYRNAGANGAAMRVGPIALANIEDSAQMSLDVWQTSVATHGHPRAILGALVFAEAVRQCAGSGQEVKEKLVDHLVRFTERASIPESKEFEEWLIKWNEGEYNFLEVWFDAKREVLAGLELVGKVEVEEDAHRLMKELGCFAPETKGSGTGTVLAALGIFQALGDDLREAVVFAVNALGSDTDTIGGFVGALSGALNGYDEVPHEWASALQDYDYFMRVATEITRIACRTGIGGSALLPSGSQWKAPRANLIDLLHNHEISEGEHVFHPLFGNGWVKSVEAQALRRKDGASVVCAWVVFDIGQTCKFRYMTIPKSKPKRLESTPFSPDSQPDLFS